MLTLTWIMLTSSHSFASETRLAVRLSKASFAAFEADRAPAPAPSAPSASASASAAPAAADDDDDDDDDNGGDFTGPVQGKFYGTLTWFEQS